MLAVGVALLVAAAGAPSLLDGVDPPATTRPRSTASLSILEPNPEQVISDDTFEVAVSLEGGRVVDATTTDLRPDAGHLHVSLDGRLLAMTVGLSERFDASGLAPGPHTLEVESSLSITSRSSRE